MKSKYIIAIVVVLIILLSTIAIFILNDYLKNLPVESKKVYSISDALSESNSQDLNKEIELKGKVTELNVPSFALSDVNSNVIRVVYTDDAFVFDTLDYKFDSNKIKPFPKIENGDLVIVKGFLRTEGWEAAMINPPIRKVISAYSIEKTT